MDAWLKKLEIRRKQESRKILNQMLDEKKKKYISEIDEEIRQLEKKLDELKQTRKALIA